MVPVLSSWLAMEIEFFLAVFATFSISWVVSLSRSERLSTKDKKSIFLESFSSAQEDISLTLDEESWKVLNEIKIEANKLLEEKRNDGIIGSSLDAEVKIFCNSETFLRLSPCIDELKFLLIVSDASLEVADDDGQSSISIEVKSSDKEKCDRCWHHTGKLKKILDSSLCPRCIENVEGEGEKRKFF